nr:MAG TPA: Protein of unknown function (DUF1351) [Caudoviricetes sp.]
MELRINTWKSPEVIDFNFEELKEEITNKSALYKNMVYTDETIKDAKSDRALLNKFKTALEDKRKEVKKQCLEPYNQFEKQIKELVAIIDEPVKLIGEQITEFEDREKAEKHEQIIELFNKAGFQSFVTLEQIYDPKWLNKSVSLKSIEEELTNTVYRIGHDVTTINSLKEYSFEALEHYKKTLDLAGAIAEGQRLADIQKRKLEHEAELKAREELAKKQAEERAKAEASLHEEPEEIAQEEPQQAVEVKRQWIKFVALLSKDDALALKEFCDNRGIEIKSIK